MEFHDTLDLSSEPKVAHYFFYLPIYSTHFSENANLFVFKIVYFEFIILYHKNYFKLNILTQNHFFI